MTEKLQKELRWLFILIVVFVFIRLGIGAYFQFFDGKSAASHSSESPRTLDLPCGEHVPIVPIRMEPGAAPNDVLFARCDKVAEWKSTERVNLSYRVSLYGSMTDAVDGRNEIRLDRIPVDY